MLQTHRSNLDTLTCPLLDRQSTSRVAGGCSPSKLIGLVLPSYKGTSLTAVLSKKTGGFDLSVEDVNSKAPF